MRLHIDTDFAGDPDDACALAMVLGWPGVELVGITTTADPDGRRAGYVRRFLELAGRTDIDVAVGAGSSLTTGRPMGDLPDHERYWGMPVEAAPVVPDAAVRLLQRSIGLGATIAAIGPYTNLALLGSGLSAARVVVMGGWVHPPADGLPAWGPERDWNVQCDTRAAEVVAEHADLTLSLLPATMPATLRAAHLPRLRACGPLGEVLARQSVAYAADNGRTELGRSYPALPDDLVNFHWDPVACAVALGWPAAVTEQIRLRPVVNDGVLRFAPDERGRRTRILTRVDGARFAETWLAAVRAAQLPAR